MNTTVQEKKPLLGLSTLLLIALGILALLLASPMDAFGQLVASLCVLVVISIAAKEASHYHKHRDWFRILALMLGVVLTLRYIIWRGMYTLSAADWVSLVAVWVLFLAEVYAAFTHVIGCIVNAFPLTRPDMTLDGAEPESLPTVDVMIPSYNESASLLEVTLRAALMLDYPKQKLRVHLLDDGGTDQKINQPNEKAAQAARQRRSDLQALCQKLGTTYHTRAKNEHAKAGNVNSAIGNTTGDLIVVLDADHVPTVDFLSRTVPWMIRNPKVFLVQTPHFMANPDPIERNYFSAFTRMPSENDMFYGTIQKGLDYWSSSFFCGSAAVLRREHLDLVGGISGDSITEDAETAFDLHVLGYESVYVDRPMVSGLAPETFDAFIQQRMRWAQGMTQILLLKKPHSAPGLSWFQRLGYLSSILFWLFPFARVVFLLMPLAYLVFGMQIYRASLLEILAFTVPHVAATYMLSTLLFGRTRWPLVSELYEILQCAFTLKALVKVFRSPRAPSFVVTPKGESLDKTFISPLSSVFYWLSALILLATVAGIIKLFTEPLTRELTVVVLLWNTFNLMLLYGVMSVLVEKRQIRNQARLPANDDMSLQSSDGRAWVGRLIDLSIGGARALLQAKDQALPEQVSLVGWSEAAQANVVLPCKVLDYNPKTGVVRFKFERTSDGVWNDIIGYALGDSRRWMGFQRRRTRPISYFYGVKHVLKVSLKPVFTHFLMRLQQQWHSWFFAKEKQQ